MDIYTFIFKVVMILAVFGFVQSLGFLVVVLERKQSALMQDRIGANRAGIPIPFISDKLSLWGIFYQGKLVLWGVINCMADALKMLLKEPFTPKAYDKFIYNLAIYFAVVPGLVAFALIPFGDRFIPSQFYYSWCPWLRDVMVYIFGSGEYLLQIANLNAGLLFILAFTGLAIYGAILGGWSSNNKFSLIGAMRGCAQMISYEVFLGISLLGVLFIYGTVDIYELVNKQNNELLLGFLPKWGIVTQPLAFILFYVAQMAENKRAPFDLPEAESEIILGYQTEYNGMRSGLFMLGEFMEVVTVSAVMVVVFLGGYHIPWLYNTGFVFPWGGEFHLAHPTVVILRLLAFTGKVLVLVWFQQLVRWSLPRFRYDQVMSLGWKGLLPLALANLVITVLVVMLLTA